jgi:hypothetical protein
LTEARSHRGQHTDALPERLPTSVEHHPAHGFVAIFPTIGLDRRTGEPSGGTRLLTPGVPPLKNTYDFWYSYGHRQRVSLVPKNNEKTPRAIIQMNAINRPEYYVVPGKHPGNCRCSKHRPKINRRTASISLLRDAGRQSTSASATLGPSPVGAESLAARS